MLDFKHHHYNSEFWCVGPNFPINDQVLEAARFEARQMVYVDIESFFLEVLRDPKQRYYCNAESVHRKTRAVRP